MTDESKLREEFETAMRKEKFDAFRRSPSYLNEYVNPAAQRSQ